MTVKYQIEVVDAQGRLSDSFTCGSDISLLSGMEEQQKKAIGVGCRGGGCGFCKILVHSGAYHSKKNEHQACIARGAGSGLRPIVSSISPRGYGR